MASRLVAIRLTEGNRSLSAYPNRHTGEIMRLVLIAVQTSSEYRVALQSGAAKAALSRESNLGGAASASRVRPRLASRSSARHPVTAASTRSN